MNKKASLLDALPILVGFFMFSVAMIFIIYVISHVTPVFNTASIDPTAQTIYNNGASQLPTIFDNLGALMIIGVPLIAAGLAYLLNANAIFFWLLTAFSALFVIAGGVISYLWEQIAGVGAPLATAAAQVPIINWTMQNYAVYAVFVVVLLLGAIFMRMRSQGGEYSGI